MPRKIALFFDGTGQSELTRPKSNIRWLFEAASEQAGTSQCVHYVAGPGTGSAWDSENLLDVLLGRSCVDRIKSAYQWLCDTYQSGDQLYIFGFSRGAFIARSLAGFIGDVGLLYADYVETHLNDAYEAYETGSADAARRLQDNGVTRDDLRKRNDERQTPRPRSVPVYFIGVFDTVAALEARPGDEFLTHWRTRYHNIALPTNVTHARHAVALHEFRDLFEPVLWTKRSKDGQSLSQMWFNGDHADIGGSNDNVHLSSVSLAWLLNQLATVAPGDGLAINVGSLAEALAPKPSVNERTQLIGFRNWYSAGRKVRTPVTKLSNLGLPNESFQQLHSSALREVGQGTTLLDRPGKLEELVRQVDACVQAWTHRLQQAVADLDARYVASRESALADNPDRQKKLQILRALRTGHKAELATLLSGAWQVEVQGSVPSPRSNFASDIDMRILHAQAPGPPQFGAG